MTSRDDLSEQRNISLKLSVELVERIDQLKGEFGLRSRGAIVERLLSTLLEPDDDGSEVLSGDESVPSQDGAGGSEFDESAALVLVSRDDRQGALLDLTNASEEKERPTSSAAAPAPEANRSRGIDLPGFVRRQSDQLRRSLRPRESPECDPQEPMPRLEVASLEKAMERARSHWYELYGTEASETVLEASMVWLAQDIWPQSDASEGRPFSWTLVTEVMGLLAPSWPAGPPRFERVMVVAGVLEDPFSTSTLELRLPTLIRRFVHRFRRRRRGSSFQTLEHTMTTLGALKLLQLPTAPGHRLTLPEIREAYRTLAMAHHPDSGGSEETMRRLNEAYQLLKELYRNP